MRRGEAVATILAERVVAIVRLDAAEHVLPVARAIAAGGLRCIEVSLTTPGALAAVGAIREALPDVLIGVGTVCTAADATAALAAGARFLVTPVTAPALIAGAHAHEAPVIMGAFTPTEIHAADQHGADLVKLFPASSLGPGYLRALLAPFPHLRLVPTGGVDAGNGRAWLEAGAVALGIGGSLTDPQAVASGRFEAITAAARDLRARIAPSG